MAGRPRTVGLPTLPRVAVPEPPADMTPYEQTVWRRLAGEVEKVGTYDAGSYSAYKLLVRAVAAAESVDLSDPDTAGTRCIALANTALSNFGLTPAARKNVPCSPVAEPDGDAEFAASPLRAVPK